jgi:hypothetical protein
MTTTSLSIASKGRPRWFDARLLVGMSLVVISIVAVVGIITASDDGVDVVSTPRLLTVGDRVAIEDLEIRRVSLGAGVDAYLLADAVPSEGIVVTRTVGAGELVPRAAVGDDRGPRATTVVVALSTALGATVTPGDTLDLWSAPAIEAGRFGAPIVITSSAQLVRAIAVEGIAAGNDAGRVELLVPRRDVARILHALANGDALSAIPTSLALGG